MFEIAYNGYKNTTITTQPTIIGKRILAHQSVKYKLLVFYNTCGISGNEQIELYIQSINSIWTKILTTSK